MEEDKYCVYLHQNKINGKCYVGITKQEPNRRWRKGKGYKKQVVFNNALQKYGWDGFEHLILESSLNKDEACNKEKFYIIQYNSLVPNGYNSNDGGECPVFTEEYKLRISKSRKGKVPSNIHWLHTPEVRRKISLTLTGRSNKATSKSVICDDKLFSSIKECGDFYGVKASTMSSWLCGSGKMPKSLYELKLRYSDKPFNGSCQNGFQSGKEHHSAKKVVCLTTDKVFDTITEASKFYKVPASRIIEVCKGKKSYVGKLEDGSKLFWKYL